jgi:hypothetical protein
VDGPSTSLEMTRKSGHSDRDHHHHRSPVDKTMEKAQKQAEKSERRGANEHALPDRTLGTMRSSSADRSHGQLGSTLPIVEEAGEASSTGGRSNGGGSNGGGGGGVPEGIAVDEDRHKDGNQQEINTAVTITDTGKRDDAPTNNNKNNGPTTMLNNQPGLDPTPTSTIPPPLSSSPDPLDRVKTLV